jgi:hypothetical protein
VGVEDAFDAVGADRHNSGVIRLALAAIVFCSALCAALVQMAPGLPDARDLAATTALAPLCSNSDDDDDDREWSPTPEAAASITESGWKCRTLHAGLSAHARPGTIVAIPLADKARARAQSALPYLLHTPLLI